MCRLDRRRRASSHAGVGSSPDATPQARSWLTAWASQPQGSTLPTPCSVRAAAVQPSRGVRLLKAGRPSSVRKTRLTIGRGGPTSGRGRAAGRLTVFSVGRSGVSVAVTGFSVSRPVSPLSAGGMSQTTMRSPGCAHQRGRPAKSAASRRAASGGWQWASRAARASSCQGLK